jgi:hypothetical protein
MDDEKKWIARLVTPPKRAAPASEPKVEFKKWRSQAELEPLARRISENGELMSRLRAAAGSENENLAREIAHDITKYAQSLDPTIGTPEGTRIVLILGTMIGHFKQED